MRRDDLLAGADTAVFANVLPKWDISGIDPGSGPLWQRDRCL